MTRKGQKTPKRCRRAQMEVKAGDTVAFYFDDALLDFSPASAELIESNQHWSIWYKPVNVPAQGTPFGDRGCMLDQVEQLGGKAPFLIHRLDREASGLMVFAHNKNAAALLSELWQQRRVEKIYQAEVVGVPSPTEGEITLPLDGKDTLTRYRLHSSNDDTALLSIEIETGRLHQIRRHLLMLGHPIVGDPRYGDKARRKADLQLIATQLCFQCPVTKKQVSCELPREWRLF